MPTAYTAKLMEKGQPFPEFVLLCARAMGACVMLRDDPLDAKIPVFEPSDYSLKREKEEKENLVKLLAMTDQEKIIYGQSRKDEAIQRNEKWLSRNKAENERLDEMRKRVEKWEPPTGDHVGLKDFMLQQISVSMNSLDYVERELLKARASFARDYYEDAVKQAQHDIEYHAKEYREECERVKARNRWIKELKASLKVGPAAGGKA